MFSRFRDMCLKPHPTSNQTIKTLSLQTFEDDIGWDDTSSCLQYAKKPFRKPFPTSTVYNGKIYVCGGYVATVMNVHLKGRELVSKHGICHEQLKNFWCSQVDMLNILDEEL